MTRANAIRRTDWSPTFTNDYEKLPDNIKLLVLQALKDLCREHIPARLRLHPLGGYRNPKVYTIDVAGNHAYKASLSIDGETARLRRVGTHKQIDRTA